MSSTQEESSSISRSPISILFWLILPVHLFCLSSFPLYQSRDSFLLPTRQPAVPRSLSRHDGVPTQPHLHPVGSGLPSPSLMQLDMTTLVRLLRSPWIRWFSILLEPELGSPDGMLPSISYLSAPIRFFYVFFHCTSVLGSGKETHRISCKFIGFRKVQR